MADTHADRRSVLAGILVGWILTILFVAGAWTVAPVTDDPARATAIALIAACLPLALGIGAAAALRHLSAGIDGAAPPPGSRLDIVLRFVVNTTEQLTLLVPTCLALWLADPAFAARLLPILGLWFAVARLLFLVGYLRAPTLRAAGFAATFHTTLAVLGLSIYRLLV
ncbi:MAG: MAPEG family protein [Jannaschia sp.]